MTKPSESKNSNSIQEQQASPTPQIAQIQDDDDQDDFDEPIWDEINLGKIQSIETQFYESSSSKKKREILDPAQQQQLVIKTLADRFDSHLRPSSTNNGLYQRFRAQRAFLSVSDLVSCLWCEVQVEYGLLGKRYLKPNQRPKTFTSSTGKQIKVNTKMVISRQNILDGGIKVHSKLEKEVAAPKVQVKVKTKVDSWALKVMNTMVSLSLLRSTGMMREIPVWGFIGGFLIQGIVDQIDLVSKSASDLEQVENLCKGYSVRISDSKTTQGEKLPPPGYTESARYQLMLYKYLYDQHASGLFDLTRFGRHLEIDMDERMSTTFMKDATPILTNLMIEESDSIPTTLREIFEHYQHLITLIGVSENTLEIVYRKRGTTRPVPSLLLAGNPLKKIKKTDVQDPIPTTTTTTVTAGLSTSLVDPQLLDTSNQELLIDPMLLQCSPSSSSKKTDHQPDTSPTKPAKVNSSKTVLEWLKVDEKNESKTNLSSDNQVDIEEESTNTSIDDSPKEEEEDPILVSLGPTCSSFESLIPISDSQSKDRAVIGKFQFSFHPIEFVKFVSRTLHFWNGDSKPVGVDLKSSNKCSYFCCVKGLQSGSGLAGTTPVELQTSTSTSKKRNKNWKLMNQANYPIQVEALMKIDHQPTIDIIQYNQQNTQQNQTSAPKRIKNNHNQNSTSPISSATIFQKNQILDWYHSNGKNQTKTAKHFQTIYPELRIKQPLISAWLKNEESIRAKKNYVNENVKRMRMIQYPQVDDLLGEWAKEALNNNHIHLTDNLLREKWKEFARLENIPTDAWLNLSHGWLSSFKARKGLKPSHRRPSILVEESIPIPQRTDPPSQLLHIRPTIIEPDPARHTNCLSLHQQRNLPHQPTTTPQEPTNLSASSTLNVPQPMLTASPTHLHQSPTPPSPSSSSSSLSPSQLPPHSHPPPPTINHALHSIQLLLTYLPATTTINNHETTLTLNLIHSLTSYRDYLVQKIHHDDRNSISATTNTTNTSTS
ncbi:hypothetical protein Pst134EA_025712 [Puccinia striiformis f. sp. tritici]|uniref:hypothetical protein n=2 Tax=Puccinia striiformis f. sp. tritici TaxID=168172 RepID=UPI002008AE44|nr:hypothetical protein Pst134EA_025712 [Puccinia striiformis f. sp. tritici]KAH9451774.1 hypothetical protein Pst134EA_025712 [Puccinia striiformis f. sp. tritici]